ncbi:hypothetical protein KGP36_06900 [Patescibacteria group bacterium]|nr:hypothetical protein [Patescibacteria group bacterium]
MGDVIGINREGMATPDEIREEIITQLNDLLERAYRGELLAFAHVTVEGNGIPHRGWCRGQKFADGYSLMAAVGLLHLEMQQGCLDDTNE